MDRSTSELTFANRCAGARSTDLRRSARLLGEQAHRKSLCRYFLGRSQYRRCILISYRFRLKGIINEIFCSTSRSISPEPAKLLQVIVGRSWRLVAGPQRPRAKAEQPASKPHGLGLGRKLWETACRRRAKGLYHSVYSRQRT